MPSFPKLPNLSDLPSFELPKFELPFELPTFDLGECSRPELPSFDQVAEVARDAAYVGLGLAVMTAERLQAAGEKLAELVTAGVEQARAAATD
jgi:hypothetical protein